MNELVVIGKTVSTFGIKGEIKVISHFKYIDKSYKIGNTILINNIEHTITSVRKHKQYILITIDNIFDINKVFDYIGYNIYYKLSNLNLKENEYLDADLIDSKVYEDNLYIGSISEVLDNNYNKLIKVDNIIIPIIDKFIIKFDKDKKILYTKNVKDTFL